MDIKMLKAQHIQINRYKGLTGDKAIIVSEEIATLKMLNQLDKEKTRITKWNKSHHVNIKGFSSNFHNYNRSNNNYSIAECLFKDQLELNNIKFLHEFQIKVKDALFNSHSYHLDFFIPEIKLAIEISPLFHFTYQTVAIRDKLRTALLKRKCGIKTMVVKVHFRTVKGKTETYLNIEDTKKALATIKKLKRLKPHKETLNAYIS
jgi:very-short-patch-repair endonuclease